MNLKESIKGNTKKFIQNVIDYLDGYCEDEQGWLDMEENILNLQKYTRFHSLNEAIKDYVMGGSLDVYYNQVNDTLNELYENTPEEAKKWEKYPDEKKWERYIGIMCLYIPKAFKKKMGRELGAVELVKESKKTGVSSFQKKSFENAAKKFIETKNKDIYEVAKIQYRSIKESLKGNKADKDLNKVIESFERSEEDIFCNSKLKEKGLTRAQRYNKMLDNIFDTKKRFQKAMSEFLRSKGVSEEEIKDLSSKDILGRKIHEMGLMDEFSKGFSFKESSSKKRSLKKIKEDYGWEVSYDNIWNLYEDMKEYFGAEELLESIVRAMGTYDLGDTLTYICRMNDYESPYLEGNEEEEEDEEEELEEKKLKKLHESKSDGWPEEAVEVLENVFDDSERFAYEVRRCKRGSFTGVETLDGLADAANQIGEEWIKVADDLRYVDDPDIDDEELEEKKIKEFLSYEEALKKVHSGEWDASKFTESVVKGIVK